jgi:hypothetical protein
MQMLWQISGVCHPLNTGCSSILRVKKHISENGVAQSVWRLRYGLGDVG